MPNPVQPIPANSTNQRTLIPVPFNPPRPTIPALDYLPAPSFIYVNQSDQISVLNASLKKYASELTLEFEIEDNIRIPTT